MFIKPAVFVALLAVFVPVAVFFSRSAQTEPPRYTLVWTMPKDDPTYWLVGAKDPNNCFSLSTCQFLHCSLTATRETGCGKS
jgi:hypothetical protein